MQPIAYYLLNKNINNVRQQINKYFSKILHLRIQQPVIELMFPKAYLFWKKKKKTLSTEKFKMAAIHGNYIFAQLLITD